MKKKPFSVTVFCAATPPKERREEYLSLAREFGGMLAGAGIRCVNGGAMGMMTALSEGARERGADVHCVCLDYFQPDHTAHSSVEFHPALSPRQHALLLQGDAYVALPGGYGTIFEVLDVITRKTLKEIPMERPLICVGSEEFGQLKRMLMDVYRRDFSRHDPLSMVTFVADTSAAMRIILQAQRTHRGREVRTET